MSPSCAGMRQAILRSMKGAVARYFSAMSAERLPCDKTTRMAVVPFKAAVDFAPAPRSEVGRLVPDAADLLCQTAFGEEGTRALA